jgi:hypothetical protein
VEREMRAGRIAEALDVMSAHPASAFPPHWDPPPRVGYGEESPHVLDVMDVLAARDPAPGVRAAYVGKLRQYLGPDYAFDWGPARRGDLARVVRILERLPEGPDIAAEYRSAAESRLTGSGDLPADEREHLNALLRLARAGTARPTP